MLVACQSVQNPAWRLCISLFCFFTVFYGIIQQKEISSDIPGKAAIRAFSSAESLTAGQIKTACDTVLKYLEGKEKRRNREFGRDRWNACMSFLANTMPPDKFEDYCRRVNEIRGVGPGSSKYVGPENFYVKGTKLESIMNDSKFRISQGTATLRDYARILAVRNMGDDDELYVGDEVFDT